jgi:hypothetical protein
LIEKYFYEHRLNAQNPHRSEREKRIRSKFPAERGAKKKKKKIFFTTLVHFQYKFSCPSTERCDSKKFVFSFNTFSVSFALGSRIVSLGVERKKLFMYTKRAPTSLFLFMANFH